MIEAVLGGIFSSESNRGPRSQNYLCWFIVSVCLVWNAGCENYETAPWGARVDGQMDGSDAADDGSSFFFEGSDFVLHPYLPISF